MLARVRAAVPVTSRHRPACPPRPIRPRSWCSWETPKRSASRITITVEFGTSTPTSMTVVETSTSTGRRRTPASPGPCRRAPSGRAASPPAGPPEGAAGELGASSSTANRSAAARRPDPRRTLLGGHRRRSVSRRRRPAGPCRPPRGSGCQARSSQAGCTRTGTTLVCTSPRPAGSSVSVEVSRSPKTVIATVRGIGVAVITSTCGGCPALPVSAARCSTPNRCCSSTTTRPEVVELDLLLEQRVRADHDPGLAAGRGVEHRLTAGGGAHRAGQQRDAGGSVGSSQPAALAEVAEHRLDRPEVLLGEHLGGCEQRRLPAGVDDLEHRPERDQGLAGADLALQQAVHRVRRGQLGRDLLADAALPLGQRERQPFVEAREHHRRRCRDAASPGRRGLGATPGEHRLGHERLVVLEPLAGRAELTVVVGTVDPAQRLVGADQLSLGAHRVGQRLGDLVDQVEREPDQSPRSASCRSCRPPGRSGSASGISRVPGASPSARHTSGSSGLFRSQRLLNHFSLPENIPTRTDGEQLLVQVGGVPDTVEEGHRQGRRPRP